jgi:GDP-L-fucose synthase
MENKILVTGGTSHLGKSLKKLIPDAIFIEGKNELDLLDYNSTLECFREKKPFRVLHLASRVGGIKSNIHFPFEFFYENILINTNVFRACKELNIPRLTSILSTCVYPAQNHRYPMLEEDMLSGEPEKTNRGYAQSKRILAEMIDLYNAKYSGKYNYIIPCNLFGPEETYDARKTHFLTSLIYKTAKSILSGKESLEMFGTGKVLRQFVTYDDLANMLVFCVKNDITESFNFTPDYNLTLKEYTELVEEITDNKIQIYFNGNGPDGIFRKDGDNTKLKKVAPNFEFTDLRSSIKSVLEFYLKNDHI